MQVWETGISADSGRFSAVQSSYAFSMHQGYQRKVRELSPPYQAETIEKLPGDAGELLEPAVAF